MFSICLERAAVFALQSSLICTCVQRRLEGRGEFLWDWLYFAMANRRIGRVRMGTVVSRGDVFAKSTSFGTSFHWVFTTESLVAEAAASLAFWRSAGGSAGPVMIYFHLLQPVILPESWSCLQPNPLPPDYKYCILQPSPANLDHLTAQRKSDTKLLVQERVFVEFPIKTVVISGKPIQLTLMDFQKENQTTAFHKFVWVKKGTRWLDHCREAAFVPVDSQN